MVSPKQGSHPLAPRASELGKHTPARAQSPARFWGRCCLTPKGDGREGSGDGGCGFWILKGFGVRIHRSGSLRFLLNERLSWLLGKMVPRQGSDVTGTSHSAQLYLQVQECCKSYGCRGREGTRRRPPKLIIIPRPAGVRTSEPGLASAHAHLQSSGVGIALASAPHPSSDSSPAEPHGRSH